MERKLNPFKDETYQNMDDGKLYVCWCKVLQSVVFKLVGSGSLTRRTRGFCSLSWIVWFRFVGKTG